MKKKLFHLLVLVFIASVFSSCGRRTIPSKSRHKKITTSSSSGAINLASVSNNNFKVWEQLDSLRQDARSSETPNFNLRKPSYVIIHHTGQNGCPETLQAFANQRSQVSSHYVICKDGKIHHILSDYLRAWHAGVGVWGSESDVNSVSIGIELDNNGNEKFPDAQIHSLISLLLKLKALYHIPSCNFIGHEDIAPSRKVDPNIYFPWKELAQNGLGLWPSDSLESVPHNFSPIRALKIIGYDVKDPIAAQKAFKRHFMQEDNFILTKRDKEVLFNLETQCMKDSFNK